MHVTFKNNSIEKRMNSTDMSIPRQMCVSNLTTDFKSHQTKIHYFWNFRKTYSSLNGKHYININKQLTPNHNRAQI